MATETHTSGIGALRKALSRLREVRTLPQILECAPLEVCLGCGFERALLFSVRRSQIVAESAYFEGDPGWAKEFLELARRRPPQLRHPLVEAEVVRRRVPMLVTDAQNDPRTIRPFMKATRTQSYVAAPVMPEGRVIGILQADRYVSGRPLDPVDTEMLWAFAEAFGCAVERAVLTARLHSQRNNVQDQLETTLATVTALSEVDVELDWTQPPHRSASAGVASFTVDSEVAGVLTGRELEVFALMAAGRTNAEIAGRLVISPSTVKSHVKQILRKLGAANRAEAVSRHLLGLRSAREREEGRSNGIELR